MAAADFGYYIEGFSKQVLSRDYFIRSARITDHLGHTIAVAHRVELMTSEESSRAVVQTVIRAAIRDK
ncbi:MAG TPA: hypothetical protein VE076_11620 [Nitrososphaeraceae archaeon]|nr:hypothetical protein [Nitrososphaeraceae archaeon]